MPTPTSTDSSNEWITSVAQLSRPYLTSSQIHFMQQQTIQNPSAYKRKITFTYQFLVQTSNQLQFPIRTIGTAMTFYQRYFLVYPFNEHISHEVALGSLFVASKVEDTLKKLKDIITTALRLRNITPSTTVIDDIRRRVLAVERQLLEAISFDFRLYNTEEYLIKMAKTLDLGHDLTYMAWKICFDSYLTEIHLKVPPHVVAFSSLLLAGKILDNEKYELPYEKFYIDRPSINETLTDLLALYIENVTITSFAAFNISIDKLVNIRIPINSELILPKVSDDVMIKDNFLKPRDSTISSKGTYRFLLGNREDNLQEEFKQLHENDV